MGFRGPKPSGREAHRIFIKPEAWEKAERLADAAKQKPSDVIERLLLEAPEPGEQASKP